MPNANDELMHHGIDGQRWGVTHGPPYPLSRADHKRIIKSAESTEKRNLSYRKSRKFAKRMSDEDLNATIDRLRREETYRNLVSKDKQEKAIARKARALDRKVAKAQLKKLKKEQEIRENQNKPKKERFGTTKELAKKAASIGTEKMATAGFTALAKALFPNDENVGKFDFTLYDDTQKNFMKGKATPAQFKALKKSLSIPAKDALDTIDLDKVNKILDTDMYDVTAKVKNFSYKTLDTDTWKVDFNAQDKLVKAFNANNQNKVDFGDLSNISMNDITIIPLDD